MLEGMPMRNEKAVLFSSPLVLRLLARQKTQTRRPVRWPVTGPWEGSKRRIYTPENLPRELPDLLASCPYGEPGTILWVKEAIARAHPDSEAVLYRADGTAHPDANWAWQRSTLPSMFMPHGLCRLKLEVLGVRVQRLQEITKEDAGAEGVVAPGAAIDPRCAFADKWLAIYGAESWDANPWVWAVTFREHWRAPWVR
jgi:hypothetical protein